MNSGVSVEKFQGDQKIGGLHNSGGANPEASIREGEQKGQQDGSLRITLAQDGKSRRRRGKKLKGATKRGEGERTEAAGGGNKKPRGGEKRNSRLNVLKEERQRTA